MGLIKLLPHKFIVDSIHGDIKLTQEEWDILDTPTFQRLRKIKQLQLSHLTYPNATHTRFAHSLGVLSIMGRILTIAHEKKLKLTNSQQKNLRLGALLHDVGHYPYSHLMEGVDNIILTEELCGAAPKKLKTDPYPDHEKLSQSVISNRSDVTNVIGKRRANEICNLLKKLVPEKEKSLSNLISSSLDLDRMDYLQRDAYATGLPYGKIDINYILNNIKINSLGEIGVSKKALAAVEHFLFARFFMHRTVYYHKTTYGMEEVLRHLLRRIRDKCETNPDALKKYPDFPVGKKDIEKLAKSDLFLKFTDSYIDIVVEQAKDDTDDIIRTLADSLSGRKPPKLIREFCNFGNLKEEKLYNGSFFKSRCIDRLKELANEKGVILGQFLFCQPKEITLEKAIDYYTLDQSSKISPEEYAKQGEKENEIVKVFYDSDEVLKSILAVDESVIKRCANHGFRITRLYFVPRENDTNDLVEELRERTSGWATPD